jgi:hypothetical protein
MGRLNTKTKKNLAPKGKGMSKFEKIISKNKVMAYFSRKKDDGTLLYNLYTFGV